MLNNTGIKKETYGSGNQILFAVEHQVSMGIGHVPHGACE